MSDPAGKSDDLIAELAKLMATTPGNPAPAVQPVARPAPLDPKATVASQPTPFRIPGMASPTPSPSPAGVPPVAPRPVSVAPASEQRAPATGTIRIPGMDQPAPVSTTAPVGKFDFGARPAAAAPIKQEPLSTLSERLAAQNPVRSETSFAPPPPSPVRVPSSFTPQPTPAAMPPVAPAPRPIAPAAPTPAPAPAGSDFHFDFGISPAAPAPVPAPPPIQAAPPPPPMNDPIADLIRESASEPAPQPMPTAAPAQPPRPMQAAPVTRVTGAPQPAAAKPVMAPISSAPPRPQSNAPIPLKPVSVAPRPAESDRFAISPGVGLNLKPAASQPLNPPAPPRAPEPAPHAAFEDSDPMAEIESLIGEAVRVELSGPGPVRVQAAQPVQPQVHLESTNDVEAEIHDHRPQPAPTPAPAQAPVVPPMTAQFAPRRSNIKDGASSAEDAILAAAAAAGTPIDRLEPAVGDDSPYRRLKVKPTRERSGGSMRQYVGMALALVLLLAAGLGVYWAINVFRTNGVTGTKAPVLTADKTPVKEVPKQVAKAPTDAEKSPVLSKMETGASSAPSSAEQLVSTDETNGGTVARDVTPVADTSEGGLANRKVRTVTVRPDGTIVSGDDAVAGTTELPVARPNVPDVPSSEGTSLLTDETPVAAVDPVAITDPASVGVIDPNAVSPSPLAFPAKTGAPQALAVAEKPPANTAVNAVVPEAQTLDGQVDLLGGGDTQAVAEAPAEPAATPVASSGNAPAYVQIASSLSEAEAKGAIKSATAKYGSLFGGNTLVVQQADLGQKGIRWRVRLPAASLSEATSICAQIKAQGGDCFPTKG